MSETRQKILESARDLYVEEGALSMRALAARVGVSATAIYRHFEDKEHLLLEVCREGFALFGASLMRGLSGQDARERLMLTGMGYLAFALEHPQYYRVMFMSPHPDLEVLATSAQQAFSPTFRFLVDRVSECQREELIQGDEPEPVARAIWAHVHGAVALWLDGHIAQVGDEEAFGAFFEQYTRRFIESFAP